MPDPAAAAPGGDRRRLLFAALAVASILPRLFRSPIPSLVQQLRSENAAESADAASRLMEMTFYGPHIQAAADAVVGAGAVPLVVERLGASISMQAAGAAGGPPTGFQYSACGLLGNLLHLRPDQVPAFVAAGGLPALVANMQAGGAKGSEAPCFQAALALWHCARYPSARHAVVRAGAIPALAKQLSFNASADLSPNWVAAGVLAELAGGSPEHAAAVAEAGAIPRLVQLLLRSAAAIVHVPGNPAAAVMLQQPGMVLHALASGSRERARAIVEAEGIPALLYCLGTSQAQTMLTGALEALEALTAADSSAVAAARAAHGPTIAWWVMQHNGTLPFNKMCAAAVMADLAPTSLKAALAAWHHCGSLLEEELPADALRQRALAAKVKRWVWQAMATSPQRSYAGPSACGIIHWQNGTWVS